MSPDNIRAKVATVLSNNASILLDVTPPFWLFHTSTTEEPTTDTPTPTDVTGEDTTFTPTEEITDYSSYENTTYESVTTSFGLTNETSTPDIDSTENFTNFTENPVVENSTSVGTYTTNGPLIGEASLDWVAVLVIFVVLAIVLTALFLYYWKRKNTRSTEPVPNNEENPGNSYELSNVGNVSRGPSRTLRSSISDRKSEENYRVGENQVSGSVAEPSEEGIRSRIIRPTQVSDSWTSTVSDTRSHPSQEHPEEEFV